MTLISPFSRSLESKMVLIVVHFDIVREVMGFGLAVATP